MRKIKYLVLIPILLVFISLNISCENDDFDIKLKQVSEENITLSSGSSLEINAQTFTVYTNFEF